MRIAMFCTALFTLSSIGCLTDEPKGEEEELLDDSKADSHLRPTDHGAIGFATPAHAALTASERYHAWTFELSGDARVDLTTSYSVLGQRRTDTVLYLYKFKESTTSWGPYIARNDDHGSSTYSRLDRELTTGRYRVIVKGHLASTLGKFKLTVGCSGAGCAPVAGDGCLFGSTYGEIEGNPDLLQINKTKITAANLGTLLVPDQQRLMLAVRQSSHTDVMTPEEALARVDQGEVNVTWLVEPAARRAFIAFEYGAGDNSYGAIFDRHSAQMVTTIHDGDLENCIVARETCLLPEDWGLLKTDPAFATESARVVTLASDLTGVAAEQALLAFTLSNPTITTLAEGLAHADDNRLNLVSLRHRPTGARIEVFEYGAGDTSVGRIYYRGTTNRAGVINDLFIEGCTLFE